MTTAGDESVSLYYRDSSSDKVYMASLEGDDKGNYVVNFQYGRRGSSLTTGTKTPNRVPYYQAKKIYDKLVSEKTGKGYKEQGGVSPAVKNPALAAYQSRDTGVRPQLLNEIDEEDLERYLTDDAWCAQEKYDGRRRMFMSIHQGTELVAMNRKGLTVAISKDILQEVSILSHHSTILDGEDMGDYVMIFDSLVIGTPYIVRYKSLSMQFDKYNTNKLRLVATAWTTAEKRALLAQLKKDNAEGIVFKRIDSMYIPGRPHKGGDQLKFKFCATATCYVGDINPVKRSVSLRVLNEQGIEILVGSVTVYPNQEIPKIGQLVEVRYLYYFKGGSLFQPVLLGSRDDLDISDCTLSQLKVKREEEV